MKTCFSFHPIIYVLRRFVWFPCFLLFSPKRIGLVFWCRRWFPKLKGQDPLTSSESKIIFFRQSSSFPAPTTPAEYPAAHRPHLGQVEMTTHLLHNLWPKWHWISWSKSRKSCQNRIFWHLTLIYTQPHLLLICWGAGHWKMRALCSRSVRALRRVEWLSVRAGTEDNIFKRQISSPQATRKTNQTLVQNLGKPVQKLANHFWHQKKEALSVPFPVPLIPYFPRKTAPSP